MKKKNIYSITLALLFIGTQAQVGINTDAPNNGVSLDVNGKTNVSQRIYLGGSDSSTGNQGTNTQLIISGGASANPVWDSKRIPDGFGETFSMNYMHSGFDIVGVNLDSNGAIPYTDTNTLNDSHAATTNPTSNACAAGTCWRTLTTLNHIFPVYKSTNKVNFVFQTVAQTNTTNSSSYACGIFLNSTSPNSPNPPLSDFKLIGVRTDAIFAGVIGDYKLFNMNVTLENLPGSPNGRNHAVRVACRGRAQGANIVVGKPHTGQTNLNSDMSRSSLNVFVLESSTGQ